LGAESGNGVEGDATTRVVGWRRIGADVIILDII
jgi:hypothetical protein